MMKKACAFSGCSCCARGAAELAAKAKADERAGKLSSAKAKAAAKHRQEVLQEVDAAIARPRSNEPNPAATYLRNEMQKLSDKLARYPYARYIREEMGQKDLLDMLPPPRVGTAWATDSESSAPPTSKFSGSSAAGRAKSTNSYPQINMFGTMPQGLTSNAQSFNNSLSKVADKLVDIMESKNLPDPGKEPVSNEMLQPLGLDSSPDTSTQYISQVEPYPNMIDIADDYQIKELDSLTHVYDELSYLDEKINSAQSNEEKLQWLNHKESFIMRNRKIIEPAFNNSNNYAFAFAHLADDSEYKQLLEYINNEIALVKLDIRREPEREDRELAKDTIDNVILELASIYDSDLTPKEKKTEVEGLLQEVKDNPELFLIDYTYPMIKYDLSKETYDSIISQLESKLRMLDDEIYISKAN